MSLEKQIDKFFTEYPDNFKNMKFWGIMLSFTIVILIGVYSIIRGDPDITFAVNIYFYMAIVCAIVAVADNAGKRGIREPLLPYIANVLSGKWAYFGLVPLVIGAMFGYFMVSQSQTIGLSFLQLSGTNAFFFIVLIAPLVEEWFFRWAVFPTFREQFTGLIPHASLVALLLANGAFGFFHFYVYGANMVAVYVAIFLGIIYTIGNYALKSGTFSIGAHMMNNYLLWAAAGGVLFG